MTRVPLALVLDVPPDTLPDALARAAALGFRHVEMLGLADRPAAHLDALAESGLVVAGIELQPPSDLSTLDRRRIALADLLGQISDAARLGAGAVLLDSAPFTRIPPDQQQEFWQRLAEAATARMMPLCVGSPTSSPEYDLLSQNHPNIRIWLHLSEPDPGRLPPRGIQLGAVRLSVSSRTTASRVQSLRRSLAEVGFHLPLALRPTAALEGLPSLLDP